MWSYLNVHLLFLVYLQPAVLALTNATNTLDSGVFTSANSLNCSFVGNNSLARRGNQLCACDIGLLGGHAATHQDGDAVVLASGTLLTDGNFFLHIMPVGGGEEFITTSGLILGSRTSPNTIWRAARDNRSHVALKLVREVPDNADRDIITGNLLARRLANYRWFNHVIRAFHWHRDGAVIQVIVIALDAAWHNNLQAHLTSRIDMINDEIRHVFLQLIDAIHRAHMNGLYNFHMQPENIIFDEPMAGYPVKLIDYDAVTDARKSCVGQAPGKLPCPLAGYTTDAILEYSVDVLNRPGRRTPFDTAAADVWNLGVLLCTMITRYDPISTGPLREIITLTKARRIAMIKRHIVRISPPAAELLANILAPPRRRIDINALQNEAWRIQDYVTW